MRSESMDGSARRPCFLMGCEHRQRLSLYDRYSSAAGGSPRSVQTTASRRYGVSSGGCGTGVLARDQSGGPQLPGGRAHLGGDRVVLGHEGLEVRLGEVVELVIGAVPEVVGALAALARLWVVRALRPGEQELVRLGDQPQPRVQSRSHAVVAVRHAQPCQAGAGRGD